VILLPEEILRLQNLTKIFEDAQKGKVIAVDEVSLSVEKGQLVTLLGPSGCGKTTVLKMIGGFELPTSGEIYLDGMPMGYTPPNKRNTSMVFQNYALFPHMTVFKNIAYGLSLKKLPKSEIFQKVGDMLVKMELEGLENRMPSELSGGQQQRVALARALITQPKLLLLDEPLSNLDAKLRVQMRLEIKERQREFGITFVYVTHDQEEAMSISDQVVVMNAGKIEQIGTPKEIYTRPKTRFIADFIGKANFIPAEVQEIKNSVAVVEALGAILNLPVPEGVSGKGQVSLVVRPEAIDLVKNGVEKYQYQGLVRSVIYLGSKVSYQVEITGYLLTVDIADPQNSELFSVGEQVGISLREGVRLIK
jgi:iron(III) transport system ATP-binding protein